MPHRLPKTRLARTSALSAIALAVTGFAAHAEPASASPRDDGARYGQALGALEVCYGSKITAAGDALREKYTGPDNDVFRAQAAKIFDAWRNIKACANGVDPNQCKIIMDKSCATAEAEIGATGSVMPGLVEFMKH